jgi:dienelactone hydrolase
MRADDLKKLGAQGVVAFLACLVAGCASVAPPFDGPGDFYDVPTPLASGAPGTLIRVKPLPGSPRAPGLTFYRVMYHSRDTQDRDVAVTGLVVVPDAPPPAGGWPIIAHGHGTTGLAPACAPSRRANDYEGWGINAVISATDYLGLGPNGQLHAYLSGPSEGRAMIDSVRAARALTRGKTSRRWIASGASQGGHAALFAGEQAPHYARELDLLGVVAVEPSSEATRAFPGDDPVLTTAVEVMSLYGRAVDHPALTPDDYVSAATAQWAKQLRTVCLADAVASFASIPLKDVWTKDPKQAEPSRSIVEESVPGRVKTSAPILLVQGGADVVVTPARTKALLERACGIGNRVQFRLYPAGDHPTTPGLAKTDIAAWLEERLAGHPAQSDCPVASRR